MSSDEWGIMGLHTIKVWNIIGIWKQVNFEAHGDKNYNNVRFSCPIQRQRGLLSSHLHPLEYDVLDLKLPCHCLNDVSCLFLSWVPRGYKHFIDLSKIPPLVSITLIYSDVSFTSVPDMHVCSLFVSYTNKLWLHTKGSLTLHVYNSYSLAFALCSNQAHLYMIYLIS